MTLFLPRREVVFIFFMPLGASCALIIWALNSSVKFKHDRKKLTHFIIVNCATSLVILNSFRSIDLS